MRGFEGVIRSCSWGSGTPFKGLPLKDPPLKAPVACVCVCVCGRQELMEIDSQIEADTDFTAEITDADEASGATGRYVASRDNAAALF